MTWFDTLTGIGEQWCHTHLSMEGEWLVCHETGKRWRAGSLSTPSLGQLRTKAQAIQPAAGQRLTVSQIVSDVQSLHADPSNAGSLFQVASQFNLLEMAGPEVTPEQGVGIYEYDLTQGPACAIAAGAGTIFRNYFVSLKNQIGQTANTQIDCIADLGDALGNGTGELWEMRNGYLMAKESGLEQISRVLRQANEEERDELRRLLRIGLQMDTEVTLPNCGHLVSQAYCSALPVAYNRQSTELWESFARLVLEASYEATLYAGLINKETTGNPTIYLTLIGGGVFGNKISWIVESLERACRVLRGHSLDVCIVSPNTPNPAINNLVKSLS